MGASMVLGRSGRGQAAVSTQWCCRKRHGPCGLRSGTVAPMVVTRVVLVAASRAQNQWGQQGWLLSVPGRHSSDFFQV